MSKKKLILENIRVAIYEGDTKLALRLFTENRISHAAYTEAVNKGHEQREAQQRGSI